MQVRNTILYIQASAAHSDDRNCFICVFYSIGAILGGATAAALGSVAGLAIITSLFGAAGAGLTGYKMKRRVGGIDEFNFQPITISKQLATTIAISGWLSNDNNSEELLILFLYIYIEFGVRCYKNS